MSDMFNKKINRRAIFSDETSSFRIPVQPRWRDRVLVRIRTFKDNIDKVEIVTDRLTRIIMEKEKSEGYFDYYKAEFPPDAQNLRYYFCLYKDEEKVYYSKVGVSDRKLDYASFSLIRGFETPSWITGKVIYQIYIDRFFNGDNDNDVQTNEYVYLGRKVQKIGDWNQPPAAEDIWNFYGGDLSGIIKKMEYLKDLGVEAIYLNPIFVSPSNHKYDVQDYEHIDPHFGRIINDYDKVLKESDSTNENATMYIKRTTCHENLTASDEVFIELVQKAHSLGIKVILDGVFNHCGAFNKWMDREGIYKSSGTYESGAYGNEQSLYRNYFIWGKDGSYNSWWGHDNHPKLNFEEDSQLFTNIMNIARKWISPPFNADGWRIDVAADLGQSREYNHYFWREFRKAVKNANPNAIILSEHYGDAYDWLGGDQWDTVMNYDAFMEPVGYFLTGMEKHSDSYNSHLLNNGVAFANTMVQKMARMPIQALFSSMNQISNHDHSRFLTRTNKKTGRLKDLGSYAAEEGVDFAVMREAVLIQMTWVGAPTVYYGDEAGLCGFTDPDNRRTYPWGREDTNLIKYHKELIKIRKKRRSLRTGSTMFLLEGHGIIGYARFNEIEKTIVLINNNTGSVEFKVPVWRVGINDGEKLIKIFETNTSGFNKIYEVFRARDGYLNITLEERSGVIISNGY